MPIIFVMKVRGNKFLKIIAILGAAIALFASQSLIVANGENEKIYLGGFAAGFTITTKGAEVLGLSEVVTESGVESPAKDAGVLPKDIIYKVDGYEINGFEDLESSLNASKGKKITATINRAGEVILKEITPVKDLSGKYKIGLFLRDKLTGIGTVTFIKGDGAFLALGHPVCTEDDKMVEIKRGDLYACSIFGVEKGERGKAGELRGTFFQDNKIGVIKANLKVGIVGEINLDYDKSGLSEIEKGEGKIGAAEIYTTVDGVTPQKFSISIVKVDENEKDNRNFVIKVTDKKLLSIAGGIVQGMSGSPIVQDGKIIGAVTHVFLNDPTRGFGISIEKMLEK